MQEVLKPQLGKNVAKAKPEKSEKGGESGPKDASESSAKRIRQAVYDIRYRARREEIPLPQAYNQYMSHTTMSGPEKSEVKSKLGEEKVFEETEDKKFQVRVTDKNSGKSYVRMATREKINQLRANPNISSVEMTKYGTPYEGEKKRGKQTASVTSGKGLDPVGHEDKDIDNDGDHDKSDKYLLNRRKARGAAIQKRVAKEEYSNWREDLFEIVDKIKKEKDDKKIVEKNISNKINVHPKMDEAIESMGGQLIEMVELEEGMTMKDFKKQRSRQKQKEKRAADKIAPNRRKDIHTDRYSPERAARHRANVDPDFEGNDERNYPGGKLNPKKVRKAKALGELGEAVLDEKTLTSAETKKKEEIVKSMKKSAGDFEKRYPGRGKEVMYATATKQAKKVAEAVGQMPGRETTPPAGTTAKQDDVQKKQVMNAGEKQKLANLKVMQQKQQMLQRQKLNLQKQGKLPLNAEEVEIVSELNRYEKETGKDLKTGKPVTKGGTMGGDDTHSKVMRHMHKVMGAGRMGAGGAIQPRGKKKDRGGPTPGPVRTPAQKVAKRRADAQRAQDAMHSRFD
jgi:hypothetical protein